MKLPGPSPTLKAYLQDIDALLQAPRTHIYIDSSFLIWALKLGQKSIGEVVQFLEQSLGDRIHVPLWAAHEFQHHLVKNSAANQAKKAADELDSVGRRLFSELAPALSEANDLPHREQPQLRLAARDAFIELSSIAQALQSWMKNTTDLSRADLVKFINAHCLKSDVVFEYLNSLDELATNRYDSRVPPGFKDRHKKQRLRGSEDKDPEPSNFAGDLVFWREILEHSNKLNRFWIKVENILLLTDDGKNDWVAGGGVEARPDSAQFSDVDAKWGPLPIVHPMLEFEACANSRVRRVALLNKHLLGALLHEKKIAQAYVNAAFNTELPPLKKRSRAASKSPSIPDKPVEETPPPEVVADKVKQPRPDATAIIGKLLASGTDWTALLRHELSLEELPIKAGGGIDANAILSVITTEDKLHVAGYLGLILMRQAENGVSSAADMIQETLASADQLGLAVSAWFYAGVLIEKYVSTDASIKRRPGSTLLEQIVNVEKADFAQPAIEVLTQLAGDNQYPLYRPSPESPQFDIRVVGTNSIGQAQKLRQVLINTLNVHDPAAFDEDCLLGRLLQVEENAGRYQAKASQIASTAARFYGIPVNRMNLQSIDQDISFSAQDGFVTPDQY